MSEEGKEMLGPKSKRRPLPIDIKMTDGGGIVDEDLSCEQCGYNLRSLAESSVCPECGYKIRVTIANRTLVLFEPEWLAKLSRGGWWLSIVFPLTAIAMGITTVIAANVVYPPNPWLANLAFPTLTLLAMYGIYNFTTAPLAMILRPAGEIGRRIARWASLIFLLLLLVFIFYLNVESGRLSDVFVGMMTLVQLAALIIGCVGFAFYCADVCRLMRENRTRIRCYVYMIGLLFFSVLTGAMIAYAILSRRNFGIVYPIITITCACIALAFGSFILVLPNYLTKRMKIAREEAAAVIAKHGETSSRPV